MKQTNNEKEMYNMSTFESEYATLKQEAFKLFSSEDGESEPPFANCIVRRALRCIDMLTKKLGEVSKISNMPERKERALEDLIDDFIGHNSIVELYYADGEYYKLACRCMAWDIPHLYRRCKFVRCFSAVADNIADSDRICILFDNNSIISRKE